MKFPMASGVALTALVLGAGTLAGQRAPSILQPCTRPGLESLVTLCATIPVRENRAAAQGRMLGIRVLVVRPDSGAELPDPIVSVPGGPGGRIISAAGGWAGLLKGARGHRALVLIDPRGTGESDPLDCDMSDGPSHPGSYVHAFAPTARLRACADSLSRIADLTQYTTDAIADDIAEVLTALGYERANFFGVSGGTRQSFVFATRFPTRVRTLILGGVVAPQFRIPLPYPHDFARSLDLLLADCAANAACHAAYPDTRGELVRVLSGLDRAPALVPVSPPGHPADTARVTRGIFADRIRSMLYSPATAATVPYVVHRAAAGDFLPFVSPLVPGLGAPPGGDGISMGHYLSITCSEDLDRITPGERAAEAQGTLLGDYRGQQQADACTLWPHAKLPASHFAPGKLAIPALLISGDADPVTPPQWADSIKRFLPEARHVVFPTGGHVPVGTPCAVALEVQFILTGETGGLDVACAATLTRPPFKLP
jgi:pimeloyl-ACP methyl ester carboxylesterase